MKLGYARTSTVEQVAGLIGQERDLKAAGADKVYSERVSSVAKREQLEAVLDYCREGAKGSTIREEKSCETSTAWRRHVQYSLGREYSYNRQI